MSWSKKYDKCISCGCQAIEGVQGKQWAHKARGLCKKCYPLVVKKEEIDRWNPLESSTLKRVGSIDEETLKKFAKSNRLQEIREIALRQIEGRVELHKAYHSNDDVNTICIERALNEIFTIVNNVNYSRNGVFRGHETYFTGFSSEHKRIVYNHLCEILLSRRFKLDLWEGLRENRDAIRLVL